MGVINRSPTEIRRCEHPVDEFLIGLVVDQAYGPAPALKKSESLNMPAILNFKQVPESVTNHPKLLDSLLRRLAQAVVVRLLGLQLDRDIDITEAVSIGSKVAAQQNDFCNLREKTLISVDLVHFSADASACHRDCKSSVDQRSDNRLGFGAVISEDHLKGFSIPAEQVRQSAHKLLDRSVIQKKITTGARWTCIAERILHPEQPPTTRSR
jgi:hypothetical protein